MQTWKVYLSGEIHSDWRERIAAGVEEAGLPVRLSAPVTDHAASDDCGEAILGKEERDFWRDHKAAKINAIRIQTLIRDADLVVLGSTSQPLWRQVTRTPVPETVARRCSKPLVMVKSGQGLRSWVSRWI